MAVGAAVGMVLLAAVMFAVAAVAQIAAIAEVVRTVGPARSVGPSSAAWRARVPPSCTRAVVQPIGALPRRPDPGHADHVANRQDRWCGSRHRESATRDAVGVPGARRPA
jgi:hypothetical protein